MKNITHNIHSSSSMIKHQQMSQWVRSWFDQCLRMKCRLFNLITTPNRTATHVIAQRVRKLEVRKLPNSTYLRILLPWIWSRGKIAAITCIIRKMKMKMRWKTTRNWAATVHCINMNHKKHKKKVKQMKIWISRGNQVWLYNLLATTLLHLRHLLPQAMMMK